MIETRSLSTPAFYVAQVRAMSQKTEGDITPAVPRTHGVRPRCLQTSGSEHSTPYNICTQIVSDAICIVFRIPAEFMAEILIYFGDPHRNILFERVDEGTGLYLHPEKIERLTIIRKLTMTCWHLRNNLLPLLWKHVEGCNIHYCGPVYRRCPVYNGLYAQCAYLILNPTIGTYVQCVYSRTR